MSKRKRPHQQEPTTSRMDDSYLFRSAPTKANSVDRESRSLDLVLASEAPVPVYVIGRGVIDEVVRVDGMEMPRQVPLLDSHDDSSVRNVLGSIRELRRDGKHIVGRAYFASDPVSQQVFANYADGHLDSFSVGAYRKSVRYDGDTRIVERSLLKEGSAVIRGADQNAKTMPVLRAYTDPYAIRDELMFEELKRKAVELGCDPKASDQEVLDWMIERAQNAIEDGDAKEAKTLMRQLSEVSASLKLLRDKPKDDSVSRGSANSLDDIDPNKITPEIELRLEINRRDRIEEMCRKHGISDELRRKWVDKSYTVDQAADEYLKLTKEPGNPLGLGTRIEGGRSEREKFYDAVRGGLLLRALGSEDAVKRVEPKAFDNFAADARRFKNRRITDIAREFCERSGHRIDDEPDAEIVRKAMGVYSFLGRADDGPSFHTTGSFANLFLDAMNKTLRAAYEEAPSTYQMWCRQGTSANDYKDLHRIVMGELNMPEEVPENHEYPEMTTSDSKESYRVRKHGGIFTITIEMMVNDDLDAMTRIPRQQGASMRRKINRDVYSILYNNPTLADGIAIFHATSHGANLDATALAAGAPVDVGYKVMATQSGLDSTTVLGITPRYLIVPENLAATALQITNGMFYPATQATIGLYAPNGPRPLTVVADGQLDSLGATTGWWLAADPRLIDTVEYTFLAGEESPVLAREEGFTTDTIKYKIRQSYGVKCIDYRGLYQGNAV